MVGPLRLVLIAAKVARRLAPLGFVPLVLSWKTESMAEARATASPFAAPLACPGIPATEPSVPGFTSGQVVVEGDVASLRLSTSAFACGEWTNETSSADCRDRWNLTLTFPASTLAVGHYGLRAIGTQFGDIFVVTAPPRNDGCSRNECPMSVKGVGSVDITDSEATLDVLSVNDDCIVGRLAGLLDPVFADGPHFNGAFFALRCP